MDELNDDGRKTYYVLKAKRQKIESTPFVRLNDNEAKLKMELRYKLYRKYIDEITACIDHIIETANTSMYDDLLDFMDNHLSILHKLDIGYVLLTSSTSNNTRIMREFENLLTTSPSKIVFLYSRLTAHTMKSLYRAIFKQLNEDYSDPAEEDDEEEESEEVQDDLPYDLDMFQNWYDQTQQALIIVVEDIGTMDTQVLNQFFKTMYSNKQNIPIKLIFGVGAENVGNWLHANVNPEVRILLSNSKFRTTSNQEIFQKILDGVQKIIQVDQRVLDIITSRFKYYNPSIDAVVSAIKLTIMNHFYLNFYSIFMSPVDVTPAEAELLRRLPSVKATVEKLLHEGDKQEIKQLLKSHEYVDEKLKTYREQGCKATDPFHEVFIVGYAATSQLVENYEDLSVRLLRPKLRQELAYKLSKNGFPIGKLFNLLKEAPTTMNHVDLFQAFRLRIKEEDDATAFAWFLQLCNEFLMMGLIKEKTRGDHFERNFWPGL